MTNAAAGERVLFEARVRSQPRWAVIGVGSALVSLAVVTFLTGDALWTGITAAFVIMAFAGSARRIRARDVVDIAWNGHDSVGLRLLDEGVEVVAVREGIPAARQAAAREAILRFAERASGARRPEASLDVAAWVVRKPPRAIA